MGLAGGLASNGGVNAGELPPSVVNAVSVAPPAWAATTTYHSARSQQHLTPSEVTYQGVQYACIIDHTSTSSFDSTKWQAINPPPIVVTETGNIGINEPYANVGYPLTILQPAPTSLALMGHAGTGGITSGDSVQGGSFASDLIDLIHRGTGDGVYVENRGGSAAEVFTVGLGSASAGTCTFGFTWQGHAYTTAAIAFNATLAQVVAAFNAASGSPALPANAFVGLGGPFPANITLVAVGLQLADFTHPATSALTTTPSGLTGGTAAFVRTTAGYTGTIFGNTCFNATIPQWLDQALGGSIPNNRTGHRAILADIYNNADAVGLWINSNGTQPAILLYCQDPTRGIPTGTGGGMIINNYGTADGIKINQYGTPPQSGAAPLRVYMANAGTAIAVGDAISSSKFSVTDQGAISGANGNFAVNSSGQIRSSNGIVLPRESFLNGAGFVRRSLSRLTGGLGDTGANNPLSSGVMYLVAVELIVGDVVNSIAFRSHTSGIGTPAHWWFALYDPNYNLLSQTADQTNTAWASFTTKTVALQAAQTIAAAGVYYAAIMVNAATMPTMDGISTSASVNTSSVFYASEKLIAGTFGSGKTDTAPASAATPTNVSTVLMAVTS